MAAATQVVRTIRQQLERDAHELAGRRRAHGVARRNR
jgi:hypothetical protein